MAIESQEDTDALVRVTKRKQLDPDDDEGSEEDRGSLLKELEHQKATNKALENLLAETIPKLAYEQTGQQIAGSVMSREYGMSFGSVTGSNNHQRAEQVLAESHGLSIGNLRGENAMSQILEAHQNRRT